MIGDKEVFPTRFAAGGDWSIFQASRRPEGIISRRDLFIIGPAWAGNLSEDGRTLVTAMDDGTLRRYRASDLEELLSLFVLPDGENWLVWSPEGLEFFPKMVTSRERRKPANIESQ